MIGTIKIDLEGRKSQKCISCIKSPLKLGTYRRGKRLKGDTHKKSNIFSWWNKILIWIKVRLKALCMGFLTHFESYQNINFSQFCDTLKYCAFYEGRTVYIINQVSQNYSIPLNFKITSTSNRLIPRSLIPTRDLAFESPWSGLSKNIYIVGGLRHQRHATRPFLNFSNI